MSTPAPFTPAKVLAVDLAQPLVSQTVGTYRRALLLVRVDGQPLGLIPADCPDGRLTPEAVWAAIEQAPQMNWSVSQALLRRWLLRRQPPAARPPLSWSIIVCTRDRTDLLAQCLEGLARIPRERGEVVIVDNDPSDDRTYRLVVGIPGVRYVREPQRGLNWARWRGAQEAAGEIVLFTDDDVDVDAGWVDALLEPFASPRVGAATGLTAPAELETPAQEVFEDYGGHGRGFARRVFDQTVIPPAAAGLVGSGANMAFRRSLLLDLRLFAVELDMGTAALTGGDAYAFYQVLAQGYQIVYTPDALVWHRHRRERAAVRELLYAYNVGAMAMLTRCWRQHGDWEAPRVALEWFRRHHVKHAGRLLNRSTGALGWDLWWAEIRGFLRGPWAYQATRRAERLAARESTAPVAAPMGATR